MGERGGEPRNPPLPLHAAHVISTSFVVMFPLGTLLGQSLSTASQAHPLVEASISSMAAGTFLFFGTLHGLASSPMIERCCNRREFAGAVAGFALMAVVAIWT